jgi:hypothetical protein
MTRTYTQMDPAAPPTQPPRTPITHCPPPPKASSPAPHPLVPLMPTHPL